MSETLITGFWDAMGTNDFAYASTWLHPDFEYYMPQTSEYLQGRANFVALNAAYPAQDKWQFSVQSIIAHGDQAVSDVEITDGEMHTRAVTFHLLRDELILRQTEYWPDNYTAPVWRKDWVQILQHPPF